MDGVHILAQIGIQVRDKSQTVERLSEAGHFAFVFSWLRVLFVCQCVILLLAAPEVFLSYHTPVSDCSQTQGDCEGEESIESVECSSRKVKKNIALSVQDIYLKQQ